MSEEQKQLVQATIYSCKCAYNFGNEEMKEIAKGQAQEWRKYLQSVE